MKRPAGAALPADEDDPVSQLAGLWPAAFTRYPSDPPPDGLLLGHVVGSPVYVGSSFSVVWKRRHLVPSCPGSRHRDSTVQVLRPWSWYRPTMRSWQMWAGSSGGGGRRSSSSMRHRSALGALEYAAMARAMWTR